MKVLVVDDDPMIGEFLRLALKEEGHTVDVARDAGEGRTMAMIHDYDVVILDYVLPDGTGVDVVAELRARGRSVPVLMLTSRDRKPDVVRGLDAGADDYLTKPFDVGELRARIRALSRRGGRSPATDVLAFGDLTADRLKRRVRAGERMVKLTPKEYALLEHFLRNPERIVSRTELLEKVWEMQFDPGSNVVDVHVARLRRKLRRSGTEVAIATVRGAGFVLTREDAPPA